MSLSINAHAVVKPEVRTPQYSSSHLISTFHQVRLSSGLSPILCFSRSFDLVLLISFCNFSELRVLLVFFRPYFDHCPLLFFLTLMATAGPTSEISVPGSHVSILLVGHSFIRRLVGYLDDQHIENFNLCDSYKVDFLASRVSTMPNLWANFSDILVKSPDVVYAEICSNDIARGRDRISLADDVFQFANCLLAHGVTTVVLGQVFF